MTDDETLETPLFRVEMPIRPGKGHRPGVVGPITTALTSHVTKLKELEVWDTAAELTWRMARTVAMQLDAGVGHYSLAAVVKSLSELVELLPTPPSTSEEQDELAAALAGLSTMPDADAC